MSNINPNEADDYSDSYSVISQTINPLNELKQRGQENNQIKNIVKEINKSSSNIIDEVKAEINKYKKQILPEKELPKRKIRIYTDNNQKYGDDAKYESIADNYIFFPIANQMVDPLRNIGLTPNMVTYISSLLTILSLYYLYIDEKHFACVSYFLGYLFDCVDGKMARKYNMGTKLGMALDLVTDNLTNIILITYLTMTKGYYHWYTPLIIFMSYMIGLSYGLNEAIACYKINGNDRFYDRRAEEVSTESGIIYDLFLMITHGSYSLYKLFFPKYDQERIDKWLVILKNFGPGNFTIFMIFILISY
jgi:phosphatidylglycerophosphate synthase